MRKVLLAIPLVVYADGNAGPDMAPLQVRHLQRHMYKAADANNVLLEQPDNEDELHKVGRRSSKGLWN